MLNIKKLATGLILAIVIAAAQVGIVAAQDTTPTLPSCIIQSVTPETDPDTSITTVVVEYKDEAGVLQTVRLSLETAESLNLVTVDHSTTPPGVVVNESAIGQDIPIDPTTVIPDPAEEPTEEPTEAEHPVGSKLGDFFGELLGVDYDTIMTAHENGTGFGVIAQALWMTNELNGDTTTFQAILDAKKSGDYSNITLPDGTTSTATNWGEFKKETSDKSNKGNLGSVMSGKADNGQSQDGTTTLDDASNGNGNNDKGNQGKGNDKGNGKDKGDKDKGGKGHGKP